MILELKHLSPYLPYGLKGNLINEDYDVNTLNKELYRIETGRTEKNKNFDTFVIVGDEECYIEYFKPILRPLSDLVLEIEHNGERFVPSDLLSKNDKLKTGHTWNYYAINYENVKLLNYEIIEKLFEWHFDVFNLIEKKLAIDINTLSK